MLKTQGQSACLVPVARHDRIVVSTLRFGHKSACLFSSCRGLSFQIADSTLSLCPHMTGTENPLMALKRTLIRSQGHIFKYPRTEDEGFNIQIQGATFCP